jgi:cob(I)alamin adenosyltransferase
VTRIYTKKGDDGSTSLWYGGRVAKSDARTEAYGAVDEAASALGMARSLCEAPERAVQVDILRIQNELFVLGAELATAPEAAHRLEDGVSRVTAEMVDALDGVIDRYMDEVDLPPKFVIPGGRPVSAALDVARATIRRAERRVVALAAAEDISGEVVRYLNRSSDAVYAMARFTDTDTPELFAGRDASPDEG